MNNDKNKEAFEGLRDSQNELQKELSDARNMRVNLQLGNIDKYQKFVQKIGELSFAVGAAIVPVVIVRGSDKVSNLCFVLVGVGLYMLNGILSLWHAKNVLETNVNDTPFIGLDEEIYTYPVIYAISKLLLDYNNKDYQEEYKKMCLSCIKKNQEQENCEKTKRSKIDSWIDVLLADFAIASLLVAKAVWIFGNLIYWITFTAIILLIILLGTVSYIKTWQNQVNLKLKQEKLVDIKSVYQNWIEYNKVCNL